MTDPSTTGAPELIDMAGSRMALVGRMGTSDSDTVLFRTCMHAGKTVPLHSHTDPECFYVLSGQIEVFIANDTPGWIAVEAGHSLLVSDEVKHAVRNLTSEPADLILATNNRLARFFREAGRPAVPDSQSPPPSAEDLQRIVRVAQGFGYWMASPAESAAVTG